MTRSLERVRRLEERAGTPDQQQQQMADDAKTFMTRMSTLAANYADSDRVSHVAVRAGWSPAQQVAWAMRFEPDRVAAVLDEHMS
ncbi:hypothetical protein [Sphingomonas endolithica]|uniref:hypothetical protein n=1 Tax=Sphingomonas endolithica TaxID=2972485 RepID=UPI0021AF7BB7|nr:hypothetical protein [Sphingomonas sp. ZFBP2030]